jgi:hypothetical protein
MQSIVVDHQEEISTFNMLEQWSAAGTGEKRLQYVITGKTSKV